MLHIPTLMLALLLGFLLLTLELGVSQQGLRARPEIRRWTLGSWALLCGFATLAARLWVPLELSVLLGNGLICLGLAVYVQAIHQLLAQPVPRWLMQCQPAIWLMLVLIVDWPLNQRTLLLSLVYMVFLAAAVRVIVRDGWNAERSLRPVALTMALAAAALLVRAVHAAFTTLPYDDMVQTGLAPGLAFLFAFMCLLGAGFGFVLAVFERVAVQMEEVASRDGMTGCWNRVTTDVLLEHELQRSRRSGTPVAFVLLDLDHFKLVNDRHGHRAGDAVLKAFADAVRRRLRSSDVFGRTGGEEFGLVLPGTDLAGARWLVETVRREVETLALPGAGGQPMQVTVSAGIALADGTASLSADRLYGRADQALYEAKRAGRNRVEVFGLGHGATAALPLG